MADAVGRMAAEQLAVIAVYFAAATAIIIGLLKTYRFFKRLDVALSTVERELIPNGGSTLRDAINRIQTHLGIEDIPQTTEPHD